MQDWRRTIGAIGLAALLAGCQGPRITGDRVPPTPPIPHARPEIAPGVAQPGGARAGAPADAAGVPARQAALLAGRVDFRGSGGSAPAGAVGRRNQALASEVVGAATVSLIDLAAGATVAGGKTDENGAFTLALGTFVPTPGTVYLLEAVKGLGNQAPCADAVRIRTFLK